ncbi:MAG: hypothetical protein HYV36_03700 [Lentisphaerae bacterium]|nr:hypothetical protein [Lentisphaerota bacterium]
MNRLWKPESELLQSLDKAIPGILSSQKSTGQFGTEPWICRDQNVVLPLAAAWSLPDSAHHHRPGVLEAIIRGGDALIAAADENGMWTFRKKDHSTWGQIHMPWTYSRWIRAFALVREAMPPDARARWEKALLFGYAGISKTCLSHMHNIPAHHAMGLYCAGAVFGRDDWKKQAAAFLLKVAEEQTPHGYWSEHFGPVVAYGFVYSDALGVYYALSGDGRVLKALERAARFHAAYTYPNGSSVETVDERNPYHTGVHLGNPGFCHTPAGRGYLQQQHALFLKEGKRFDADYAASLLLYGAEGEVEPTAAGREKAIHRLGNDALIARQGPWFVSLSAFVCEPAPQRWQQDRQNFVSVFHDRTGLIVGGGNTKLQPLWSTFTVGDISTLKHTPGDENPNFRPSGDLRHFPSEASLTEDSGSWGLRFKYGEETCSVLVSPESRERLRLVYETTVRSGKPVEGHVTLIPRLEQPLIFASGEQAKLGQESIHYEGEWVEHAGWRMMLSKGARLVWPALPHNPYRKGGEAEISESLLVVALPFAATVRRHELVLECRSKT